jgi:hypothetical protein
LLEAKRALEAQAPEGASRDPFEHERRIATAAAGDGRNGHEPEKQVAATPDESTSE